MEVWRKNGILIILIDGRYWCLTLVRPCSTAVKVMVMNMNIMIIHGQIGQIEIPDFMFETQKRKTLQIFSVSIILRSLWGRNYLQVRIESIEIQIGLGLDPNWVQIWSESGPSVTLNPLYFQIIYGWPSWTNPNTVSDQVLFSI